MKKIKNYFAFIAVFALLFTSCSKDESNVSTPDNQMATLSFGAVLNDLANKAATKQSIGDLPECSEASPSYVEVVLSQNGNPVAGTMANPLVINLSATPGDYDNDGVDEYFTLESPDLELEPGTYSLDFFGVYDSSNNLIWLAPKTGEGSLADYVDNPLPLSINLGAGVKKYVDVNVLCYDNRMVNQYGYLFFDIETNKLLQFCLFANYCDGNVRHYPASYSVNVWLGTDNTGTPLYTNETNTVSTSGEDPSAEPLCLALPDLSEYANDEAYIYYEVTLLDWPAVYGTVEPNTVISGTLSRDDIQSYYDGNSNINYDHLRFGCDTPPTGDCPGDQDCDGVQDDDDICPGHDDHIDTDNDGIPDGCDTCPNDYGSPENGGCPIDDCTLDSDGDGVFNCNDNCPNTPNSNQADSDNNGIGDVCDYQNPGGNGCETAFMFGNTTLISLDLGNKRWGWTEHFSGADGSYEYNLYAGAGQNDTSKGYLAGVVTITVNGSDVGVTVNTGTGVSLNVLHVYLEETAPTTTAPGQYGHTNDDPHSGETYHFTYSGDGDFWIIVHAEVCN